MEPYALPFRSMTSGRFTKFLLSVFSLLISFVVKGQDTTQRAVYITSPQAQTSYVAPAIIPLNSLVYDPLRTFTKTAYYLCSSKIAEVTDNSHKIQIEITTAGTYTVVAKATDSNGTVTESCPVTFTVNDSLNTCNEITADFSNSNVCQGSNTAFWSTSYGTPYPDTFEWKVNGNIMSTGSSMNYTFPSPGTYSVQLRTGKDGLCAATTKNVTVSDIAGPITGPAAVCEYQQNVTYTVPSITGATYNWWLNGEGSISGNGTNTITIDFGQTFTDLNVGVTANGCYREAALSLQPSVRCGQVPDSCNAESIFARSDACINQNTSFWSLSSGDYTTLVWKINGVEVSTSNSFNYTFTSDGSYIIELGVGVNGKICATSSQTIELPETAGPVSGTTSVCNGQEYTYSIDPKPGAQYNWWLESDAIVDRGQGTNEVTVSIGAGFESSVIKVGVNYEGCYKESSQLLTSSNCNARSSNETTIINTNNFLVFPHPFKTSAKISLSDGSSIQEIVIYTVSGKKVYNKKNINLPSTIIGNSLRPGYYILHLITESKTYTGNLVKQ